MPVHSAHDVEGAGVVAAPAGGFEMVGKVEAVSAGRDVGEPLERDVGVVACDVEVGGLVDAGDDLSEGLGGEVGEVFVVRVDVRFEVSDGVLDGAPLIFGSL